MTTKSENTLLILERLARLAASSDWRDGINPTQRAALVYLTRANRFSRTPSAVTDYLAATKGTVSQTLQALDRKGLVARRRDPGDRRSVRYDPTKAGKAVAEGEAALETALATLGEKQASRLEKGLSALLAVVLDERLGSSFGRCASCRHFKKKGAKAGVKTAHYCTLFEEGVSTEEAVQICREHSA